VIFVLEFDGPAWQRALARARDNANRHAPSANPAAGTVSTWNFWLASASNRGLPL